MSNETNKAVKVETQEGSHKFAPESVAEGKARSLAVATAFAKSLAEANARAEKDKVKASKIQTAAERSKKKFDDMRKKLSDKKGLGKGSKSNKGVATSPLANKATTPVKTTIPADSAKPKPWTAGSNNPYTPPKNTYKPHVYSVLKRPPNLAAVAGHRHILLLNMLTFMRPEGSAEEKAFVNKFIRPVADWVDGYGNYHRVIGKQPRVLFSSHTDTVHRDAGYQNLILEQHKGGLEILTAKNSTCLGTDDATGIYLMLKMIKAGVEGHYIFHRAEEVGCLGSKWIVKNTPHIMKHIDIAVAFDRKGTTDVITKQSSGKCASDECGKQLAEMLNEHDMKFTAPVTGVYTDTAHYNELVPECFNLSVGYYDQHTTRERQDLTFLDKLLKACLSIKWNDLKVVRKTTDLGRSTYGGYGSGRGSSYNSYGYDYDLYDDIPPRVKTGEMPDYTLAMYTDILKAMKDDAEGVARYIFANFNLYRANMRKFHKKEVKDVDKIKDLSGGETKLVAVEDKTKTKAKTPVKVADIVDPNENAKVADVKKATNLTPKPHVKVKVEAGRRKSDKKKGVLPPPAGIYSDEVGLRDLDLINEEMFEDMFGQKFPH